MIKFEQHIPGFVTGLEPEKKTFKNLKELLMYHADWLIDEKRTLCFACDYEKNRKERTLMISSITDKYWWVIGYVKGIALEKYLPLFQDCYIEKKED